LFLCLLLCGCETFENIRSSDAAKTLGTFQLNPVQPNNYWYNGNSYEYNLYEIRIESSPAPAKIKWDNKYIGTTPFVYKFTGVVDKGDRITVMAFPVSETLGAREAVLKVTTELPREIHFDFNK
jgi:hypothetical protein